ncbi:MAG: uroporphyrinogen decarboxylase family protein [Anaerolineae bacterium]
MGVRSAEMVRDPELDVRLQLERVRHSIESMEAAHELGVASYNYPAMDLIHYGTGPLATAFGARFVLREGSQPAFEATVHTPEEASRLTYPNLYQDGICPQILERIAYYNEATQGRIPIHYCDTAGPWSIATQLWHYEDIMEAIYTAPDVVHHVLNLVTDAIMEWCDIQVTHMRNFLGGNSTVFPWTPRGFHSGDDTIVCVSPKALEEFYLPYNNRLSRHYGGYSIHCCMRWDFHYLTLATKTVGFMGFETSPEYNDIGKLEQALSHRGVWNTPLGDMMKAEHGESGRRDDLPIISRLRGKCGMVLGVYGDNRQDALDRARRLLDALEIEHT